MGGTRTDEAEPRSLTDQPLDALIPAPMSMGRKFVISVILVVVAIAFTTANVTGLLVPRPFDGVSFSTGGAMILDTERNAVGAFVAIPNNSNRDVRLTSVDFDAPGAELVDVVYTPDFDRRSLDGTDLPATISTEDTPGIDGGIWVLFRPTTCEDPTGSWGFANVTFDFGDGAFPPVSATERVEDEVWSEGQSFIQVERADGTFVEGHGPLSLACEVLR